MLCLIAVIKHLLKYLKHIAVAVVYTHSICNGLDTVNSLAEVQSFWKFVYLRMVT